VTRSISCVLLTLILIDFMNLHNEINPPQLDNAESQLPSPYNEEPQEIHNEASSIIIEGQVEDGEPATTTTLAQHQTVLTFDASRPTFTLDLAIAGSTPTTTTKKDGARCTLCVQALCELRFSCTGRVNRKWCKCNHPPLVGRQKVRWSEAEVKRRRALLNEGEGTSHT
jgi:hypothetical protein